MTSVDLLLVISLHIKSVALQLSQSYSIHILGFTSLRVYAFHIRPRSFSLTAELKKINERYEEQDAIFNRFLQFITDINYS